MKTSVDCIIKCSMYNQRESIICLEQHVINGSICEISLGQAGKLNKPWA